jgi:hypothetical protein
MHLVIPVCDKEDSKSSYSKMIVHTLQVSCFFLSLSLSFLFLLQKLPLLKTASIWAINLNSVGNTSTIKFLNLYDPACFPKH